MGSRKGNKKNAKANMKAAEKKRAQSGPNPPRNAETPMTKTPSDGLAADTQHLPADGHAPEEDAVEQSINSSTADEKAGELKNAGVPRKTLIERSAELDPQNDLMQETEQCKHCKADPKERLQRLEQQVSALRETNNDLYEQARQANEGRVLDRKQFDDQRGDFEREKNILEQERDTLMQDRKVLKQEKDELSRLNTDLVSLLDRAKVGAAEAKTKYDTLLKLYEDENRKVAILAEQVKGGLPMAAPAGSRGKTVDSSLMKRRLQRMRSELVRREGELADLRIKSNRNRWEGFDCTSDMIQTCKDMFDSAAPVFMTMVAMAKYVDGDGDAERPTDKELNEVELFKNFLDERAEMMKEAFSASNPGPMLEAFEAKWQGKLGEEGGWGIPVRLHLAVVKAASLIKVAKRPAVYVDAVDAVNKLAKEAEMSLGNQYPGWELVKEINDRVDELRHRKPAKWRMASTLSSLSDTGRTRRRSIRGLRAL